MTKMFIPSIGFQFQLTEPWTFTLHNESRNESLWLLLNRARRDGDGWRSAYVDAFDVTLPVGTILRVDRMYIRKGAAEYDSVTFYLNNYQILNAPGVKKGALRFWAKLDDVNKIVFDKVDMWR